MKMSRLMLVLAVAGAVAYTVVACQSRRTQRVEDEEAVGAWENEGGAAPAGGPAEGPAES
jgi:hypothetical protein